MANIGSGLLALLSAVGGGLQGAVQQNQQNITNQQKQGLLDVQKGYLGLGQQAQAGQNLQSGIQADPSNPGQMRYDPNYLRPDPNNPGHMLTGQQVAARDAATAKEPMVSLSTIGLPGDGEVPTSVAQPMITRDMADRAMSVFNGGAPTSPMPSASGQNQGAGPTRQSAAGLSGQPSSPFLSLTKAQGAAAGYSPGVKSAIELMKDQNAATTSADEFQQKLKAELDKDTRDKTISAYQGAQGRADTQSQPFTIAAAGAQKGLDLLNDKTKTPSFGDMYTALASSPRTIKILQDTEPKSITDERLGNQNIGSRMGRWIYGDSAPPPMSDYAKNYYKGILESHAKTSSDAANQIQAANVKNLQAVGVAGHLPIKNPSGAINIPQIQAAPQVPKMNPQDIRSLRAKAAAAIARGADPVATKKRFSDLSGTDYGK